MGNNISVSGRSTIMLSGSATTGVQVGTISSAAGSTLNLAGPAGKLLRAAGTSLSGTATFNTAADLAVGQVSDGGTAVTMVKQGTGRMVFDNVGLGGLASSMVSGSLLDIQAGKAVLQGINGGTNPIGAATLQLDGGSLLLDTKFNAVTYNNPLVVAQSGTMGVVPDGLTLTLGSATAGVSLGTGKTLTVDVYGGSRNGTLAGVVEAWPALQFGGAITGGGNLAVQSTQFNGEQYPVPGSVIMTASNTFSGSVSVNGTYNNLDTPLTLTLNSSARRERPRV